ncbi:hypothetical protein GN956_G4101 [Arapaima gigas]
MVWLSPAMAFSPQLDKLGKTADEHTCEQDAGVQSVGPEGLNLEPLYPPENKFCLFCFLPHFSSASLCMPARSE